MNFQGVANSTMTSNTMAVSYDAKIIYPDFL